MTTLETIRVAADSVGLCAEHATLHEGDVDAVGAAEPQVIYWHRELPPLDARPMSEHVVEASSAHVPDTIAHRDELWKRCEGDLMSMASQRLRQEVARLGGRYAHVLGESIETRHNACSGEAWLHGRFTYMLYR